MKSHDTDEMEAAITERRSRKRVTMTRGADGLIAESDDWWQREATDGNSS